ncbi:hypothetical protein [Actinomadura montaniterrae]|uniref:PH domain-containing protein n=1 Tax=Actinomadura montaniterrae TaxID=1803903 RepID=A0A6L3W0B7_9ACTN|nr:hypothetical protein [Actinomadura montaniterrae]KAB2382704.1 hypothetical protein F9B16_13975 [Actinomadura montaniterrae]
MDPEIVVVLSGLTGARKAGAVLGLALGPLVVASLGAGLLVEAGRMGSDSVAGLADAAGIVALIVAIGLVSALFGVRHWFAHPRVWLDGTVLHAHLEYGVRSCDLSTVRHVVVEDVPHPPARGAGIVTAPRVARLEVQGDEGLIDVVLFDARRRAPVPEEALKALAGAILAGPERGGRAAEAARRLREMAER